MRRPLATISIAVLTAAGLLVFGQQAKAATEPVAGTGTATAHSVTVHSSAITNAAAPGPVLGKNGKPAGPGALTQPSALTQLSGLNQLTSMSGRPTPPPVRVQPGGPNTGSAPAAAGAAARPARPAIAATGLSDSSFTGATEANSSCSGCATPYVAAAVSATQIAETVNLSLQVFSKSGAAQCSESLISLLGAFSGLTEPRIQYDNVAKRYSMVIASTPSTSSDVPVFYLATSQADNACGAWWVYQIILSGNQYPLGAQLNYPYLGQDSTSLLASTNNFTFASSYLGTGAFAMPKTAAYAGNSFNITTYSVDFSTAPAVVAGIPTESTTTTYWVAAVPGTGFDVFSMPTKTAGAISYVGTVDEPFDPPSRNVRQPGTSETLNPLDGRIQSAVVQDGNDIWFANDIDDSGYPTVLYGVIDGLNGDIEDALAYHGSSSDDFNPSIGVSPQGSNTDAIWVNWAYTTSHTAVSATVNGVAPGAGVPDLTSGDLTLVTGVSTTSISTFGAYSSTEVDPSGTSSCPAGLTALSAQEYFSSASQWSTRLAETAFC